MDRTEFKKRMQSLKSYREQNPDKGYWDWRNSLPDDLPYTDDLVYDMRGAYESGAQPELQDDGTYHLPTRDSRNGRILKKSLHPTYWKGLEIDAGLDYNPYFFGDVTYTWNDKDGALIPWGKVEQFKDGGDNTPMWLQEPYQGPTYDQVLESLKKNDPAAYNRLAEARAREQNPTSEIVRYIDANGNMATASNAQGLQPVVTPEDLPGIGDAAEVYSIGKGFAQGNYRAALAGLGLLAIPGGAAGKIYRSIKDKYGKQGLVRAIYNNIAPGSYYESYIPGGNKRDEIKGALKDYVLGRGDKVNPKWEEWFKDEKVISGFLSELNSEPDARRLKKAILEARKEAWMNYLGIPHQDKYLINTGITENGMPVYRSNVSDIPNTQLNELTRRTEGRAQNKQFTTTDFINSTGGNVGVTFTDKDGMRTITTEDVWDLNPFKDANRARILPSWLRNRYSHIEVQPDGYKKVVWNNNAPSWLVNFEPSKLINVPGPFINRTNVKAKKLTKDQLFTYKTKPKSDFVDENVDIESNLWEFDSPKDYEIALKQATRRYSELYDKLLKYEPDRLKITIPKDDKELLSKYGLFVRYKDGGEVPPDNSPVHVNPFTKKPLANGAITPVLNIEDAANFTPAGDVLSIRDAYTAAKNNDLLGLGLAGLGFLPFVPRIGRSKVSKVNRPPIPEVHPDYFQKQMEKAERAAAKRKQTVNDFYTQQDQAYESLIENEDAFRRAVNADASTGTNYTGVYGDYIKNYSRESSRHNDNLTSIRLTDDIPSEAKAQVDPRDLNWIRVNSRYADPDELDPVFQQMNPGLVRHELGHITDEKAGLDYTNKLGDRSKFESESKLKEMFPKTYKRVQDYLLRGSEIKSHMNEFRDYLSAIGQYSPTETAKSLRQKLDKYGSNFKNLKILFDAYKNKRQFARDYNTIPLIGTSALGINYYLNQEEQRRD